LSIFSQILKRNKRKANRDLHFVVERDDSSSSAHCIPPHGKECQDISMQVDWSPISKGGFNFKSSSLYKTSNSRIEIKISLKSKLYYIFIIVMAIIAYGAIGIEMYLDSDQMFTWYLLVPAALGLFQSGIIVMLLFFSKSRYFDKQLGWFWEGKKSPSDEQVFGRLAAASPLKELVALQVISKEVEGRYKPFTSWEINIIHKDGARYNIIGHGDKEAIDHDARIISEFLSIPILIYEKNMDSCLLPMREEDIAIDSFIVHEKRR